MDHVPTLHCGGGNVVGATFDSSSQRGISQTSEVGKILGSTQAPSAILIINDAVISCTHSMLLERVPLPQVTEQWLHGPALHLYNVTKFIRINIEIKIISNKIISKIRLDRYVKCYI